MATTTTPTYADALEEFKANYKTAGGTVPSYGSVTMPSGEPYNLEVPSEYTEAVNLYRPGGGYGAGQNALIAEAEKKDVATGLSQGIASGMSSGSYAQGLQSAARRTATTARLGVEDVRTQNLAAALSARGLVSADLQKAGLSAATTLAVNQLSFATQKEIANLNNATTLKQTEMTTTAYKEIATLSSQSREEIERKRAESVYNVAKLQAQNQYNIAQMENTRLQEISQMTTASKNAATPSYAGTPSTAGTPSAGGSYAGTPSYDDTYYSPADTYTPVTTSLGAEGNVGSLVGRTGYTGGGYAGIMPSIDYGYGDYGNQQLQQIYANVDYAYA